MVTLKKAFKKYGVDNVKDLSSCQRRPFPLGEG